MDSFSRFLRLIQCCCSRPVVRLISMLMNFSSRRKSRSQGTNRPKAIATANRIAAPTMTLVVVSNPNRAFVMVNDFTALRNHESFCEYLGSVPHIIKKFNTFRQISNIFQKSMVWQRPSAGIQPEDAPLASRNG